jgi:hypothetical protein
MAIVVDSTEVHSMDEGNFVEEIPDISIVQGSAPMSPGVDAQLTRRRSAGEFS